MNKFIIEDEMHSEYLGEYNTLKDAVNQLKKLSQIPWGEEPNMAPCMGWETCCREYVIIEYDNTVGGLDEIRTINGMSIDAQGIGWDPEFFKIIKEI